MQVFQEPAAHRHETGPHHPERPARLDAVADALASLGLSVQPLAGTRWSDPQETIGFISTLHEVRYIERFRRSCREGRSYLDVVDCAICAASFEAAVAAAGCALAAADAVMVGGGSTALSAMRPPGHHAEADRAMGFCFFNNAALAAQRLLAAHALARVAIVDFDVHHGNGTQHLFESRGDVLYISTHQHPATLYPGTGYEWERGRRGTPGENLTLNIPLSPGSGHAEAIEAIDRLVLPALAAYGPQAILVSAGFDADARDPLAALRWTPATYGSIARRLADAAAELAGGRIVTVLEGGYDTHALREGLTTYLDAIRTRLNE